MSMTSKIINIGFVAFFSACGRQPMLPSERSSIDQKMAAHMAEFVEAAKSYGVVANTSGIKFGNVLTAENWANFIESKAVESSTVGLCERITISKKQQLGPLFREDSTTSVRVTIVENTVDPVSERVTAFHELGHCVFGMAHYEDKEDIMNAILPSDSYIAENYQGLLKQFFDRLSGSH